MTTQKYLESTRSLLSQAKTEPAAGDIRQASEKGWGAAAQMVKAVAQQRGWQHPGRDLRRGHRPTLRAGRAERGLRDIETFLDKLQPSANEQQSHRPI